MAKWQTELADAIKDPAELLEILGLDKQLLPQAQKAAQLFPLRVPRGYVARIQRNNPGDPLLRQVLPLAEENLPVLGFSIDPVGDLTAMTAPGVLHKYQGRVLLVSTGACGIHCRYCFRRHFPYSSANPASAQWQSALEYIQNDSSIQEVILSGGDPLTLSDSRLASLTSRLVEIPHVKRLRLHTRMPVVLPERIDDSFLKWITSIPFKVVMVIHANHANEFDDTVRGALSRLLANHVTLLNQSVLLKGVNDSSQVLANLSEVLFEQGITPYYLHLLDRVQGAAHFEVQESRVMEIIHELRRQLPGYLVPRLVRERQGKPYKTSVG